MIQVGITTRVKARLWNKCELCNYMSLE